MLFLWDCNCPSILLCSVLFTQLESLVLCAFGSSTMIDEYSYLSLGVLQAQTWPSTRVLYIFDKILLPT